MEKEKLAPVPKVALPIIKIIRAESARPDEIPRNWSKYLLGPLRFYGGACPMGLCRRAKHSAPMGRTGFPYGVSNDAIAEFYEWWDGIPEHLAKEAVERVWGKKETR